MRKKPLILLMLVTVLIFTVGCSNLDNPSSSDSCCSNLDNPSSLDSMDNRTLDFRSIACAETGRVVSIGDSVTAFKEVFGEGEYFGHGLYSFLDGALEVGFDSGKATGLQFNSYPITDRVAFYNVDLNITVEQAFQVFDTPDLAGLDGAIFNRFFDSDGNEVPREESDYILAVAVFEPVGLVYIVLHQHVR